MSISLPICYGFILWLLSRDGVWKRGGSPALLIPFGWLLVQGSRPLSYWFGGGGGGESHPVNTLWYALVFFASIVILLRRRLSWIYLFSNNKTLICLYIYFFVSIFWSDSPTDSFKRVVKDFEAVLVALVVLTERNVVTAIGNLYVRVSYILFPLSMVFIKYFPAIGRNANRVGENMFTGVTTQKNSLGLLVFVVSLVIIWDLVNLLRSGETKWSEFSGLSRIGMIILGFWLLVTCDSQTSLLCLLLGAAMIWTCQMLVRLKNGKILFAGGIICVLLLFSADKLFGISGAILTTVGRDPTLTGRTAIWDAVLNQPIDSVIGNGFWVFWYSDKGAAVTEELLQINSAHNGFLEMYLDGGFIGITLLIIFLISIGVRAGQRLFDHHVLGVLGVTIWIVAIPYNLSESSFFRMDILWFTLLLLTLECRCWTPISRGLGNFKDNLSDDLRSPKTFGAFNRVYVEDN